MVWNRFLSVFCFKNQFGMEFWTFFLFRKWFRTEFGGFFSSENGTKRNCEVFSIPKIVWNGIPRFISSANDSDQNSEGFSLPRNGSEQNSKVFLFHKTGGIPTEPPPVPSCSVFCVVIFCRKMATVMSTRCYFCSVVVEPQTKPTNTGNVECPIFLVLYAMLWNNSVSWADLSTSRNTFSFNIYRQISPLRITCPEQRKTGSILRPDICI